MKYNGYELPEILQPSQRAVCVEGLYVGYVVQKWKYSNTLIWPNEEIVNVDNDVFFKYSKWEIMLDRFEEVI